ncbi:tetratricopeptide repeat protein [Streptomyces atriruber]|uniref:tetratricopeptide repeat protein n=1 Tax=Streptomyces atriruber TaxID=545121 RepID=UPI0006E3405B|nr:tetratricopeptide repeat protein [Streptomyces atriruber]
MARTSVRSAVAAVAIALVLTSGAVVISGGDGDDGAGPSAPVAVGPAAPLDGLRGGDLDRGVEALRSRLHDRPKDFTSWATLGTAYVEQARTRGDPALYRAADRALDRSLKLRPGYDAALAGRAAVAAARHDFRGALRYATDALAENPYGERALATRIDALVELGRYDEASRAADEADSRRPGVPVFTRYAYVRELRGDTRTARRVLERALDGSTAPGDVAYVSTALGQLAWRQGDYRSALRHCGAALRADATYLPALECRARAQAAQGRTAAAIAGLRDVVARQPLPGPVLALGELYEARGDTARAREQYRLVHAWAALARANGVDPDLDTALASADHGDRRVALRAARAEWERRRTVHTADALGWALHVNGRNEEALRYARRATATGFREAAFLFHRGMIERAVGDEGAARKSLASALRLNPGFSPVGAREARAALRSLGGDAS